MKRVIVDADAIGQRLDISLTRAVPEHSRTRWKNLISDGHVQINGSTVQKPGIRVAGGDIVEYEIPPPISVALEPENRAIDILFEDSDVLVLNKSAGWVVHPGPGHETGTLVHALLYHCPDLKGIGGELRPGIVHRLDRDTSGLLVVAKSEQAHRGLVDQFRDHSIRKEYLAIVFGRPEPEKGTIQTLIGRSEKNRQKMSTQAEHGRMAITHYEVIAHRDGISLLRVRIETGRTHQIRVHLTHIGCPIVGDSIYGSRKQESRALGVTRQMLHAERISFQHPTTGQDLEFSAPMPADMRAVVSEMIRTV